MSHRSRLVVLALVGALVVSACGGGGEEEEPQAVDQALAPAEIPPDLRLFHNSDEETLAAFANAGENTAMADGEVWEIRRADRLIGTLQISTVLPEIDLTNLRTRLTLVRQILSVEPSSIRIAGVEVYAVEIDDRASYLWFGDGIFQVLQIRDRSMDSFEPVVQAVLDHQRTERAWVPLPPEADLE